MGTQVSKESRSDLRETLVTDFERDGKLSESARTKILGDPVEGLLLYIALTSKVCREIKALVDDNFTAFLSEEDNSTLRDITKSYFKKVSSAHLFMQESKVMLRQLICYAYPVAKDDSEDSDDLWEAASGSPNLSEAALDAAKKLQEHFKDFANSNNTEKAEERQESLVQRCTDLIIRIRQNKNYKREKAKAVCTIIGGVGLALVALGVIAMVVVHFVPSIPFVIAGGIALVPVLCTGAVAGLAVGIFSVFLGSTNMLNLQADMSRLRNLCAFFDENAYLIDKKLDEIFAYAKEEKVNPDTMLTLGNLKRIRGRFKELEIFLDGIDREKLSMLLNK